MLFLGFGGWEVRMNSLGLRSWEGVSGYGRMEYYCIKIRDHL